jgi:hypothetical protein
MNEKTKPAGGFAFARPIGFFPAASGTHSAAQHGMTLRDYFAARAPERIEEWFQYEHPTPRPSVPFPHLELDAEEQRQFNGMGEWLEEKDVSDKVREFAAKHRAARDAAEAYDRERARARYCAWRYAYADGMIAARGEA